MAAAKKPVAETKQVEKSLEVLNRNAQGIARWLQVTKLETAIQKDECADARRTASGLFEDAEDDRKSFTAPLNAVIKQINERYRPVTDHAKNVKSRCDALLLDWQNAQRQLEMKMAAKEAAKAEKQGAHELAQDILDQAANKKVDLGAGVSTRRHYAAKLVDPKKVPVDVWMLVEEEIVKKVSAMARTEKERFNVAGFELVVSEIVQGGGE